MEKIIIFRSRDETLIRDLSSELAELAKNNSEILKTEIKSRRGLIESWFSLEAVVAFAAGLISNMIANEVSNIVHAYLKKKEKDTISGILIEVRIDGELIKYDTIDELSQKLREIIILPNNDDIKR